MKFKRSTIGRFLDKIIVNPSRTFENTPCWEWRAALSDDGYGRFKSDDSTYAHRFSYSFFIGDIPKGFEVDHRCHNRRCVSPFHIRTLTHVQNMILRPKKTKCVNGHPLIPRNILVNNRGARVCRACQREKGRRLRENQRAAKDTTTA